MHRPIDSGRPAIVLPHNSAAAYAPAGTLDESGLCQDAACWTDRAALATAIRGSDSAAVPDTRWAELLAREDPASTVPSDLIEVVLRDGQVPIANVHAVRVSESDFDAITDAYLRSLLKTGATVLSVDQVLLVQIAEADQNGALRLEVVR